MINSRIPSVAASAEVTPEATYTIQQRGQCVLITGDIPTRAFAKLSTLCPGDAVMSPRLARLAGCTMAMGSPAQLRTLETEFEPAALARVTAQYASSGLRPEEVRWLALGERGQSSNAMFATLAGFIPNDVEVDDLAAHPCDPDDLRRCRLLLEQLPWLVNELPAMAAVSATWARLVEQWDELCATMEHESPQWRDGGGRSPTLARLLREIQLGSGRDCDMEDSWTSSNTPRS